MNSYSFLNKRFSAPVPLLTSISTTLCIVSIFSSESDSRSILASCAEVDPIGFNVLLFRFHKIDLVDHINITHQKLVHFPIETVPNWDLVVFFVANFAKFAMFPRLYRAVIPM